MMSDKNIAVYGAGGHAKVVIEVIRTSNGNNIMFIIDDNPECKGEILCGYEVIGGKNVLLENKQDIDGVIVAIGDNSDRFRVSSWLHDNDIPLLSAVHPNAVIADSASIGLGTVVMPGCIINPDAKIGNNVIINSGSIIEHDCVIQDNVHIAPGVTICGGVTIGKSTLVGTGATMNPCVSVGENCVIGAGAAVVTNVADNSTATGVPARVKS